jgi:hypothetical protein
VSRTRDGEGLNSKHAEGWALWWPRLERARRQGRRSAPAAVFLTVERSAESPEVWLEETERWGALSRGISDHLRLSIIRYARKGAFEKAIRKVLPGFLSGKEPFRFIDKPQTPERLNRLSDHPGSWAAIAAELTREARMSHEQAPEITARDLRFHAFDGPWAVHDFEHFVRTGVIARRQPPFPDQLSDLWQSLQRSPAGPPQHWPTRARKNLPAPEGKSSSSPPLALWLDDIKRLARTLARRSPQGRRHIRLWSTYQPSDLTAACWDMLHVYWNLCNEHKGPYDPSAPRRLPVIYVPIGSAPGGKGYVSRKAVVCDLHYKLCIQGRHYFGNRGDRRRVDSRAASAEQIDNCINEIRDALGRAPALIVLGLHFVPRKSTLQAVQEETSDGPAIYLINRLMPSTGLLKEPFRPENSYGTRILVLADDGTEPISNQRMMSFGLKRRTPRTIEEQLKAALWMRLRIPFASGKAALVRSSVANELELTILQSACTFSVAGQPRSDEFDELLALLEQSKLTEEDRLKSFVRTYTDQLLKRAAQREADAWFATILHAVALVPGGVRRDTVSRVLAGYIIATSSASKASRPDWIRDIEHPLAEVPHFKASQKEKLEKEVAAFEQEIQNQLRQFRLRAGALIHSLPSAHATGVDEYQHPFEVPESPALNFLADDATELIDFAHPMLQHLFAEELNRTRPEKHALLRLLLCDENLRRAFVIQRHGTERDHLSLVEKRHFIAAIYHGLQGLKFDRCSLIDPGTVARWSWIVEADTARATYRFIYRVLYKEHLNGGGQLLSRQHGAETLKQTLIKMFLDARELLPADSESSSPAEILEEFVIHAQLLDGLAHSRIRTINSQLGAQTLQELEKHHATHASYAAQPPCGPNDDEDHRDRMRLAWVRALRDAERLLFKLRLDDRVIRGLAEEKSDADAEAADFWERHIAMLTRMLERPPSPEQTETNIEDTVRAVLDTVRAKTPPCDLTNAVITLSGCVVEESRQFFYDALLRIAECLAVIAESHDEDSAKHALLCQALVIFELAEAFRVHANRTRTLTPRLQFGARPVRYATRLCLTLGRKAAQDPIHSRTADAHWYFERSAYYAFHFVSSQSQFQIERIAALIIQASTVRVRGQFQGKALLEAALKILKRAEQYLIHYPDRTQLWLRFYLERSKVFRDLALQPKSGTQEPWATYCMHDVRALYRLAAHRPMWKARAKRVAQDVHDRQPTQRSGRMRKSKRRRD